MFGPSFKKIEVLWLLLTSAAICISIRAYLRLRLSQISPGKNTDLHPMYLPHLPPKDPGSGWALFCFANSPSLSGLDMRFLSVRSGLCRQLPSDSTSRWTPLLLANTPRCQAYSGLSPPSLCPCWAHNKKSQTVQHRPGFLFF